MRVCTEARALPPTRVPPPGLPCACQACPTGDSGACPGEALGQPSQSHCPPPFLCPWDRTPAPSPCCSESPPAHLTCLAAFGDEGAQGLAHSEVQVRALTESHAQGVCQPAEGVHHIRGTPAKHGQQGPHLEGKQRLTVEKGLEEAGLPALTRGGPPLLTPAFSAGAREGKRPKD